MVQLWLRCNLRSPDFGTKTRDLARIHLDQGAWADAHGFEAVLLGEHHGFAVGFNPSPMILGAAIASRTSRIRLECAALFLPLHDPVRVAEDIVMLDNISDGRVDLTIGLGYVKSEFEMYGVAVEDRAKLVESKTEALRCALRGDQFLYGERKVHVTPRPVQSPHPPLYFGGGVKAAARRAARLGCGFMPTSLTPDLLDTYLESCLEFGKKPGPVIDLLTGPQFVYVTDDPDKAWRDVAPHAVHEANRYSRLLAAAGGVAPYRQMDSIEDLKRSGLYAIVTPQECIELARRLEKTGSIMSFNPTMSGLSEALSWESLELFASKVLPDLTATSARVPREIRAHEAAKIDVN